MLFKKDVDWRWVQGSDDEVNVGVINGAYAIDSGVDAQLEIIRVEQFMGFKEILV